MINNITTIERRTVKIDKPKVFYYKFKRFRVPRKIKKWLKLSPHFAGFIRKCPLWTQDGEFVHSVSSKEGMQCFMKPRSRKTCGRAINDAIKKEREFRK